MFNCVIKFEWKNVKNGMKGTFRGPTSRIMFTTKSRNTFAKAFNGHVFPMTREIHLIGMALGVIAFTNPQRDHFDKERDPRLSIIKINNENTILDDKGQLLQIESLCAAVKWIKDHGRSEYVARSSTDKAVDEIPAADKATTETTGSSDSVNENAKKPVKISAKQIDKLLKALKKISDKNAKSYLEKLECKITILGGEQSAKQAQNDKQNDGNLISSASFESNASDQTKKAQESSIDSIVRSATKNEDEEKIRYVLNCQIRRGSGITGGGYWRFKPYEFHKDDPRRVHVYTIPSLLGVRNPIIGELMDMLWATKNSPDDLIKFDGSFITRSQGRDILLKLYESIKNKSYKTSTNPPTYHDVFVLAYDDGADNRSLLNRLLGKKREQMGACVAFTTVGGLDESATYYTFDDKFEILQNRMERILNEKQNGGDRPSISPTASNESGQTKKSQGTQHKSSSSSIDDFDTNQDDDKDDLDDIIIPEIHDNDDWKERLRRINDIKIHELTPPSNVDWDKRIKELNEHLTSANARIIEMRRISEENQGELNRLNKMVCDLTRERDELLIKLRAMENEKKKIDK